MTGHVYDKEHPLHTLEGWVVFYGQQAQRTQTEPAMGDVFPASCETAALLLELMSLREKVAKLNLPLNEQDGTNYVYKLKETHINEVLPHSPSSSRHDDRHAFPYRFRCAAR